MVRMADGVWVCVWVCYLSRMQAASHTTPPAPALVEARPSCAEARPSRELCPRPVRVRQSDYDARGGAGSSNAVVVPDEDFEDFEDLEDACLPGGWP